MRYQKFSSGAPVLLFLALSGCATAPFAPSEPGVASFSERPVAQRQDNLEVSAAVVGPEEILDLLGLNLYADGIQPVWLRVENHGRQPARLALRSIDDEYFSPFEVAWKYRRSFRRQDRQLVERWFYEHRMPRRIPPGETRTGFVYTHRTSGTKGFNVDLYAGTEATTFTFFLSQPGFIPDYMDIDFAGVYERTEIRSMAMEQLFGALSEEPCCSTDESGTAVGDPFNIAIVGTPSAVRRALLRAGWNDMQADSPETVLARAHRYRGRRPDGVFHRSRPDGASRRELRLWLAPMRVGDDLVWLGQASYDLETTAGSNSFERYRIDPDIDDARDFVVQNLWYTQSLIRVGLVGGAPANPIDRPQRNFNGEEYFTDGQRALVFVSELPVAMDEAEILQTINLGSR